MNELTCGLTSRMGLVVVMMAGRGPKQSCLSSALDRQLLLVALEVELRVAMVA